MVRTRRQATSVDAAGPGSHTSPGRGRHVPVAVLPAAVATGDQQGGHGAPLPRVRVPPRAEGATAAATRPTGDRDARMAIALMTLDLHQMSRETARCAACHQPCPCDVANDAANTLAGGGYPVVESGESTTPPAPVPGPGRGPLAICLSWLRARRPPASAGRAVARRCAAGPWPHRAGVGTRTARRRCPGSTGPRRPARQP